MDITPQNDHQQPMSDDQELAKALAGVMPDAPAVDTSMQFEETPAPHASETPLQPEQVEEPPVVTPEPVVEPVADPTQGPTPVVNDFSSDATQQDDQSDSENLSGIKKDALLELRPLIGKVDLPPEEKFDTYLMLIRSTDDPSLIAPAHVAAQSIPDEKRRAEALLDVIKEIDYLSRNNQPTA